MATKSRFTFPGFEFSRMGDTLTHHVEVGTVEDGGHVFILTMIRNKNYPNTNFLVSKIANARGREIWNFPSEYFPGNGFLARAGEEIVIALVGRGKEGVVERVISLRSLHSPDQPDLSRLITLKRQAAQFLNREYILSEAEALLGNERSREQQEAELRKLAESQRAQERQVREERRSKILSRGSIVCYAADGSTRHGIPVLASEWQSLPDKTKVIIVEKINDGTEEVGSPVEAFEVIKSHGKNPEKGRRVSVTAKQPMVTELPLKQDKVEPSGRAKYADAEGKIHWVLLYASIEQIRIARAQGLNGGTEVAVKALDSKGRLDVYAVHREGVTTKGKFLPTMMI